MRLILRLLPRTIILTVSLCAVIGCDNDPDAQNPANKTKLSDFGAGGGSKKDEKKKDKALDKSPDEVRNEALEQVVKNLDKQQKLAEEAIKKGPQNEKKNNDKKKHNPTIMQGFSSGGAPLTELEFDPKDKHPNKAIPLTASKSNGNFAEITGPGQPSPSSSGGTFNLSASGRSKNNSSGANDLKVMNGRGSAELGDDVTLGKSEEKQPFYKRWLGIHKAETKVVREAAPGEQIEIPNATFKKKYMGQVNAEKPDGTEMGTSKSMDSKELRERYNPFGKAVIPTAQGFKAAPSDKLSSENDRIAGEMLRIEAKKEAERRALNERAGKTNGPKPLIENNTGIKHPLTDFDPAPVGKNGASKNAQPPGAPIANTSPVTPDAPSPSRTPVRAGVGNATAPAVAGIINATDNAPITADSPVNTDFNAAKFAAPENVTSETPVFATTPSASAAPDSEAGIAETKRQLGTLEAYRKGLETRDIVAREAAFQRAAAERRTDAIPALVEEVARNGMLAVTAARVLAIIGKTDDYITQGLMVGLNSESNGDAQLREACAETLGQLRAVKAVPLLIDKAKTEKNYTVRSTCVAALGMIGDSSAITTLHMKLDDHGEIEFVKQSAALALARFGDPAGRDHLIQSLESPSPAYQVLGLTGLAQLNDARTPGYLISCLDSRYDEVWTTGVMLFPRIGARSALPLLREQLQSGSDVMRMRAALALGFLGCPDGVALICRATRSGSLQERAMGCELLGRLNRTDQIPLLLSMVNDANSQVRIMAATALARVNAKEAIPLLADAARGRFRNQLIQPVRLNQNEPDRNDRDSRSILSVQLGSPADMSERLVMLNCIRILRGEKDDLAINTLPSSRDSSWPEFDRELLKQQVDLIKMYKLVDVVPSGAGGTGALLQVAGRPEILYRKGEVVAGGFKISEISVGVPASQNAKALPPFCALLRGDERIILYQGLAPEIENVRKPVK